MPEGCPTNVLLRSELSVGRVQLVALNAASSEARSLLRLTMRAAAHREFGPFSPATMKAISYIGAVVGGTPSMLYFDWNGDVSSHTFLGY